MLHQIKKKKKKKWRETEHALCWYAIFLQSSPLPRCYDIITSSSSRCNLLLVQCTHTQKLRITTKNARGGRRAPTNERTHNTSTGGFGYCILAAQYSNLALQLVLPTLAGANSSRQHGEGGRLGLGLGPNSSCRCKRRGPGKKKQRHGSLSGGLILQICLSQTSKLVPSDDAGTNTPPLVRDTCCYCVAP